MNTRIRDLSLEELKVFINEAVDQRLEERFGDPDIGLEVKPEIIEKIRRIKRKKEYSPVEDAAQRLGLKW